MIRYWWWIKRRRAKQGSGPTNGLLTEGGDYLLTEGGDFLILE
jgi:hypothetical protein